MVSRILHVARGAQRGADLPLPASGTCVIGAAPGLCDVVVQDEGVASRHCSLSLDARGHVICTALEAPVWVGQRMLARGASMALPDFLPLRCGRATLLLGPQGTDWSYATGAAESAPGFGQRSSAVLDRVRSGSPIAFAALLLGSTLLVAGSVWGAVSWLTAPQRLPDDQLARAQRWLLDAAPPGSELRLIVDDSAQRLVVSGTVATERDRQWLGAAVARQAQALLLEVSSREQQQRAALPAAGIAPPPQGSSLRGAERRFAVLMSNLRASQLVGPAGERWREGDAFEGMTIRRILFDQVEFERGGEAVVLSLPLLR